MTLIATRNLRAFCALLLASFMLAGAASALQLEIKSVSERLAARKNAARQGKLPLPGTPDLKHLNERLAKRGLTEDGAILIRIFKAEAELEIWINRGRGGAYTLFATYPICYWSGSLGPKLKEGDRQAPEGFYTVTWPRAHPGGRRWPQALNIGYPNPFDQLHLRSGSHILIHGGCASIGCFAMTNAVNKEVHKLALRAFDAGQAYIHVHAFPFRMTRQNLARYETPAWKRFWRNLKQGYDLFERTHRPPRISICNGRYTFEETGELDGANPGPIAVCPRTQTILADLRAINSSVAELSGPPHIDQKSTLALAGTYAGWQQNGNLTRRGPNSLQQLAPKTLPSGISPALTQPLRCSLLLASCRKYAALREAMLHKAIVRLATPVKKKRRTKRRHHNHAKKKRQVRY